LVRRRLVVAALVVVLAVSSAFAVAGLASTGGASSSPALAGPRLATPILSARRAPALLRSSVGRVRLADALDGVLSSSRASTCLTVEEGSRSIYVHQPDLRLIPASTMKVLTGMAALRRLGDSFTFTTSVVSPAVVGAGGVVDGPLWLVGSGDPLLSTSDYAASFRNQPQVFTSMEVLADRVVAAGVREVRGGIVGDDSRFDGVYSVPSWKPVYLSDGEVGPISALMVNDNFAQFRPRKAIATPDPAVHGATILTALLQARGVVVGGSPARGVAPDGAPPVASISSPPLPEVVGEMLRESDNATAEMLTKELGKRFGTAGSWDEGIKVIRATLITAGLPGDGYSAVDGSGLDVADRMSCRILMDALDLAGPTGPVASGFAVAGRTGTLATRFKGNPAEGRLRAKTGTLNYVAGLVGFLDPPPATPGPTLEFALLANDLPDRSDSGRLLQDLVAAALAEYPDAPAESALSPLAPR
jgi:D-alanyl-D-alanine carboxypeptidase/D-alanyl-D-alanine-endopeptidase (penicillin-binding protein 4)